MSEIQKMSVLDGIIAANIIFRLWLEFRNSGITVDLNNLAALVAKEEAESAELNAQLNGE